MIKKFSIEPFKLEEAIKFIYTSKMIPPTRRKIVKKI